MKTNLSTLVYSAIGLLSALLLISGWAIGFAGGLHYISAASVSVATVQSGDFIQRVTGYVTVVLVSVGGRRTGSAGFCRPTLQLYSTASGTAD